MLRRHRRRVDGGVSLAEALARLEAWLREQGLLGAGKTFVVCSWTDWDFKVGRLLTLKNLLKGGAAAWADACQWRAALMSHPAAGAGAGRLEQQEPCAHVLCLVAWRVSHGMQAICYLLLPVCRSRWNRRCAGHRSHGVA